LPLTAAVAGQLLTLWPESTLHAADGWLEVEVA
jgi:hypothetical protein